ncbi:MAG TPA: serine--tRNA ligase [Cellvibrionales bacterium]|jgi:seryl-tRNA synthetase|nr:serine--tRNA ligase [Cellvibrionales bacterium]HAW13725.1 serine--tRNA ligase [Cellvibrionales bacterium]HCX27257.1 serine--tRNA ligase [Cellvibrionales bacterium]
MLDIKYLRSHLDDVAEALTIKGYQLDKAQFEALDAERKHSDIESQSLLAKRKQASKKIGELVQSGLSVDDAKAQVNETLALIDSSLSTLKQQASNVDEKLQQFLYDVPNIPDAEVPAGKDESDNVEVLRWGTPRSFDFDVLDHVALGAKAQGLDFEVAAQMTGTRFAVLKGGVARLHRALAQFMLDQHTDENNYLEVNVPLIVNAEALTGTGQLPKFEEDLFKLTVDSDYYLIPTAEVPVTNLVRDTIVDVKTLPLKFVAHTSCFRSEAGSHGRDTRGLIRQHQFEKVELVQVVKAEDSAQALETLTGHAESILQKLDLPYRKVILCGGDLSFGSRKTYDLEVWLPAQDCYREISSCSNFGDYQARRLKARTRSAESAKPELLHTLNGSGLAVGRTLVAVLENHQNQDGTISIPKALQPYMNGLLSI